MKRVPDTKPIISRLRTKSPSRFAIVLLCLLGFLFQSHVARTHFHHCGEAASAQPCSQPAGGDESSQRNTGDNPASCALCQIAAHGGAAPLPAAELSVTAPQPALLVPADVAPSGARTALSHSWQSRAPPTV